MDALSDVLRVIRLKGGVFLHAEFTGRSILWPMASLSRDTHRVATSKS